MLKLYWFSIAISKKALPAFHAPPIVHRRSITEIGGANDEVGDDDEGAREAEAGEEGEEGGASVSVAPASARACNFVSNALGRCLSTLHF
jgi:hypothetical protein